MPTIHRNPKHCRSTRSPVFKAMLSHSMKEMARGALEPQKTDKDKGGESLH